MVGCAHRLGSLAPNCLYQIVVGTVLVEQSDPPVADFGVAVLFFIFTDLDRDEPCPPGLF